MTDMIVSGAGTGYLNGTWTQVTDYNGKSRYIHPILSTGSNILWFNNKWIIGYDPDYGATSGNQYYSTDDVATPDLVTTWIVGRGSSPVPTVTYTGGATGNPHYYYAQMQ